MAKVTVKDIYDALDRYAPFSTQMSFDNAGFLVGRSGQAVSRLLVALDITEEVVSEAAELGCQLIVSHHPVIFRPARSITDETTTGRILLALAEGGISAICAHTNLDAAVGGVNDALAERLGLEIQGVLEPSGTDGQGRTIGIGRFGELPEAVDLPTFAGQVKERLGANGARYVDAGRPVRRVAVGGGSCGDMLELAAAQGCDTFVTADVKYDQFLMAKAMGLGLIDAGHYPTENVVCGPLAGLLRSAFPAVEVSLSRRHREVFSYR